MQQDEKKCAIILSGIAGAEGLWCIANLVGGPARFFQFTGFSGAPANPLGWIGAAGVVIVFTLLSARLPSVRANLLKPSVLKLLALAVAVTAGFCEEAVFRKFLMDRLSHSDYGAGIQILISGGLFGAAHGIWGAIRGSIAAAVGATVATGILGAALAVVYLASGRNVAPCIAAHLLINALVEPGLVLAAVRSEMGMPRKALTT